MKRPLAVTGLTYLVTLAVIFHFYSSFLVVLTAAGAAAAVAAAVIFCIIKSKTHLCATVALASLSVGAALLSLFLFQHIFVQPVISQYAEKTICAEGYIGDTVSIKNTCVTYVIHTEAIDGEPCQAKIKFTTFNSYDLYPFDRLSVTLTPQAATDSRSLCKGIFLYAVEDNDTDVTALEGRHTSLYSMAVSLRQKMTHTLERCLTNDAADMAKAVLLGEKQALSDDIYQAFAKTGTSYLIVVSGMHLAIVTFLLRKLFEHTERRWLQMTFGVLSVIFILLYMAITGFTASVTRAGIMLILTYMSTFVFRDTDTFTSLGIAALMIVAPNPYAVGDIGLLLSFAATFGIALWAKPMADFCLTKLKLPAQKPLYMERTRGNKIKNLLQRPPRWFISFLCTSVAATLWVMPVTVLFFGKISPLTPLLSLIAYPLIGAVLLLSFVLVLLPIVSAVLSPLINTLAALLLGFIGESNKLPFCSVPASETYIFIWLAVSAVLVTVGYAVHAKKLFVFSAVFISLQILVIGGSLTALFADNTAVLSLYRFGSGYTAMVTKGNNLSLLSCGGAKSGQSVMANTLSRVSQIDNIIVPGKQQKYISYLPAVLDEKTVSNLFVYETAAENETFTEEETAILFHDNTNFTVRLNSDVSVTVFCASNRVFRYVFSNRFSLLIMPPNSDAAQLPEELRRADVILLEGKAKTGSITANRVISLTGENGGETPADGEVITFQF